MSIPRASKPRSAPNVCDDSSSRKIAHYRIQKNVRDLCIFARQNVTVDPPFSRVDLVTLPQRPDLHVAAAAGAAGAGVPLRAESRRVPGAGLAETVGSFDDLFDLANRTHKIYRKKETTSRPQLTFMPDDWLTGAPAKRPGVPQPAAWRLSA